LPQGLRPVLRQLALERGARLERTGSGVISRSFASMRFVPEGKSPVSTSSTPSSPMTAVTLPLTSGDWVWWAMTATTLSATFTVSKADSDSGVSGAAG
jgi:hypothetical protein